jgi:hypothetical protein
MLGTFIAGCFLLGFLTEETQGTTFTTTHLASAVQPPQQPQQRRSPLHAKKFIK